MENRDALCQLVIRNMEVIEEAPKIVGKAEKDFFEAINAHIKQCVSQNAAWSGYFALLTGEDEETTFAPDAWPKDGKGGYDAWYTLTCTEDGDCEYTLSCALGVRGSALCFSFGVSDELVNMKKGEKKKLIKAFYDSTFELEKAGFLYDGGEYILRPFFFDTEAVAEEYRSFDQCLAPLDEALNALFEVHPKFDAFVKGLASK